jgi:type I restriction enzyme M protein
MIGRVGARRDPTPQRLRGQCLRKSSLTGAASSPFLRVPTDGFTTNVVKATSCSHRQPGSEKPWTKRVWVYDLRTNMHSTLKTERMTREDPTSVACYPPHGRQKRKAMWPEKSPNGRWRAYPLEDVLARDKVSLDLLWLRDESLDDSATLLEPHVLAEEIADDLRDALEQIESVLGDLGGHPSPATAKPLPPGTTITSE